MSGPEGGRIGNTMRGRSPERVFRKATTFSFSVRDNRRALRIKISLPVSYQLLDGKSVLPDVYEGHVVDITYELGAREEYEPFMAALKTKMTEQNAELLFSCESRGCGSSGLWANTLFKVRELYGPNGTQVYFVVKLQGEVSRYLSAYGIERGNRRQYVHIRMVELDIDQSQFQGAQQLLTDGWMILPVEFAGNRVSPESREGLREMAVRMQALDVSELAIIAHRPVTSGGTLADAITQSNARAVHVQALLKEAGLMIDHAQGVGPLVAPGGLSPDRVEIVKFR